MFNGLFSSLFGKTKEDNNFSPDVENDEQQVVDALESRNILSEIDGNVRVVLLDDDKDWLFVETETQHPSLIAPSVEDEEEAEAEEKGEKKNCTNNLQLVPFKSILSHLSSARENDENCLLSANLPALYPNTMDESWFLTPPSCFSSASIQLETSPIENLLIEHPSMSVYHNIRRGQLKGINNNNNEEIIEDLVVLELSQGVDNDDAIIVNKGNKRNNRNKNKNARTRPNNQQQKSSVALVLVTKNGVVKAGTESRNVAMSRSFFERNNKTTRNSYKKNLHTINQPSSRTMSRKN